MSAKTILASVFAQGGRAARNGEYTVVYMQGCTFVTSPMEFAAAQNWARSRMSCGNPVKDRTAFVDRIETVLARSGSGIATKGSRVELRKIVKNMTANAMLMEEWSVPRNLNESVEIKRIAPVAAVAVAVPATVAAVAVATTAAAPAVAAVAAVAVAAVAVAAVTVLAPAIVSRD